MLILQHVHEADGEHAPSLRRPFERALHPVVVVGLLVRHDDHLAFAERQLVLVVGLAVIQRPATSEAAQGRQRRLCVRGQEERMLMEREHPAERRERARVSVSWRKQALVPLSPGDNKRKSYTVLENYEAVGNSRGNFILKVVRGVNDRSRSRPD